MVPKSSNQSRQPVPLQENEAAERAHLKARMPITNILPRFDVFLGQLLSQPSYEHQEMAQMNFPIAEQILKSNKLGRLVTSPQIRAALYQLVIMVKEQSLQVHDCPHLPDKEDHIPDRLRSLLLQTGTLVSKAQTLSLYGARTENGLNSLGSQFQSIKAQLDQLVCKVQGSDQSRDPPIVTHVMVKVQQEDFSSIEGSLRKRKLSQEPNQNRQKAEHVLGLSQIRNESSISMPTKQQSCILPQPQPWSLDFLPQQSSIPIPEPEPLAAVQGLYQFLLVQSITLQQLC